MPRLPAFVACCAAVLAAASGVPAQDAPSKDAAVAALHKAVQFFRTHASVKGGYVFRVSADLTKREGEEKVGPMGAWIQPPGTPAVGMAYMDAYRLTQDPRLLDAALETGVALVNGQLESGGWDVLIEFDPEARGRYAYRVDKPQGKAEDRRRNITTFDDDKSQSCLRFLMDLDRTLEFKNAVIHEAVQYAQDAFLKAQYPNGAWPQGYSEFPDPAEYPVKSASYPESWPRTFPGVNYRGFYTLNDSTISDLIRTLLDAYDIYGDERFLAAAKKGGEFFLLAQMPDPQPGWAQQYDRDMHPAWARKFEPPAITGGESQAVMQTLINLYHRTADEKYLAPIPKALAYYRTCLLPNGRLARFYELRTNQPLYFTKDYQLTDSSADMPTHYAFIVSSRLDRIEADYKKARERGASLPGTREAERPKMSAALAQSARAAIDGLDARGAWVQEGRLRNFGSGDDTREVIDSRTFIENLQTLARFVAAGR